MYNISSKNDWTLSAESQTSYSRVPESGFSGQVLARLRQADILTGIEFQAFLCELHRLSPVDAQTFVAPYHFDPCGS